MSDSELWGALKDKDLLQTSLRTTVDLKGLPIAFDLYDFTKNSDGSYSGTPEDKASSRVIFDNIKLTPDDFYLTLVNDGIYNDGKHQDINVVGFTYANFSN